MDSGISGVSAVDADYFQQCKYIHEVELVNMKLQMRILETHLETKDRLLRNLEDIIDEQETRITHMEDFIQVLSLDFGTLSEENIRLKKELVAAQKKLRLGQLVEEDAAYESDIPLSEDRWRITPESTRTSTRTPGSPDPSTSQVARTPTQPPRPDISAILKMKRIVEELRAEKEELKELATLQRNTFAGCVQEAGEAVAIAHGDYLRMLVTRYKEELEKRKRLHNQLVELNGNIRVYFRIRPQKKKDEKSVLRVDKHDEQVLYFDQPSGKATAHAGEKVIPMESSQRKIFEDVSPIITSCIDGYNVCIFAYGHTGSGKTHTMEGPLDDPGINQRALMQLFETANQRKGHIDYNIAVSMLEIYNEKIRDLLNSSDTNLTIRLSEDGTLCVPGLREVTVTTVEDVTSVLNEGRQNKAIASTAANPESSRSHVIVRVVVTANNRLSNSTSTGRLNLVDLAGSERVSQTNATGQLLKEAQAINKSLSELGNVVLALRQGQKHIPFRNCQLTRILEDSLTGDSKTLVIVHLSPESRHCSETVSSLSFAEKISQVQTKVSLSPSKTGSNLRASMRTSTSTANNIPKSPKKSLSNVGVESSPKPERKHFRV